MPEVKYKQAFFYDSIDTTVTSGQQLSGAIDIMGADALAISSPAGLAETTATLVASETLGGSYVDVTDEAGNAVTVTLAASKITSLGNLALVLAPLRFIKIKLGSNAGADRVFKILRKG